MNTDAIINFLLDWQVLVGAATGGIMGILGAMYVEHANTIRQQKSAAIHITTGLSGFTASHGAIYKRIEHDDVDEGFQSAAICVHLKETQPRISPLFEESYLMIATVDDYLAAHLSLFYELYTAMIDRINSLDITMDDLFDNDVQKNSYDLIADLFDQCQEHARCSTDVLNALVLSRWSRFHKLYRSIKIPAYERPCRDLLSRGDIENPRHQVNK